MTAIVILNVVLAAFVLTAVLSLLGWGIFTDQAWAATRPFRRRGAHAHLRSRKPRALRAVSGRR